MMLRSLTLLFGIWLTASVTAEEPAFRLASVENDRIYRRILPALTDGPIRRALTGRWAIPYTRAEMPLVHQQWDGVNSGAHSSLYNISAVQPQEPIGNANREFPWNKPFGTDVSQGDDSYKFLYLPPQSADVPDGPRWPIVWYSNPNGGHSWVYPDGAVVAEVLYLRDPQGFSRPFEVRTRSRTADTWQPQVFRPFPTAKDLSKTIKAEVPDWWSQPDLVKLVTHLDQPLESPVMVAGDTNHPNRQVFQAKARQDRLPPIQNASLVSKLLHRQFLPVRGGHWRDGDYDPACPEAESGYHIVPVGYRAAFVEVSRESCMRCHETTNREAREFDAARDWYGRVRGSDGIFSFHPFAPEAVAHNGFSLPVAFRQDIQQAGLFMRYDPAKHPKDVYRTVGNLR